MNKEIKEIDKHIDNVYTALESRADILDHVRSGEYSSNSKQIILRSMKFSMGGYGTPMDSALESSYFATDIEFRIATENFIWDAIKAIFEAIKNLFKKVISGIKRLFGFESNSSGGSSSSSSSSSSASSKADEGAKKVEKAVENAKRDVQKFVETVKKIKEEEKKANSDHKKKEEVTKSVEEKMAKMELNPGLEKTIKTEIDVKNIDINKLENIVKNEEKNPVVAVVNVEKVANNIVNVVKIKETPKESAPSMTVKLVEEKIKRTKLIDLVNSMLNSLSINIHKHTSSSHYAHAIKSSLDKFQENIKKNPDGYMNKEKSEWSNHTLSLSAYGNDINTINETIKSPIRLLGRSMGGDGEIIEAGDVRPQTLNGRDYLVLNAESEIVIGLKSKVMVDIVDGHPLSLHVEITGEYDVDDDKDSFLDDLSMMLSENASYLIRETDINLFKSKISTLRDILKSQEQMIVKSLEELESTLIQIEHFAQDDWGTYNGKYVAAHCKFLLNVSSSITTKSLIMSEYKHIIKMINAINNIFVNNIKNEYNDILKHVIGYFSSEKAKEKYGEIT